MPAGLRAQQTHLERKTRSRLRTFRLTAVQLNAGLQQRQRTDSFLLASPGLSERRRRQQLTRTPYGHDPPRWPPRAGRTPVAPAGPRPLGTAPHCSACGLRRPLARRSRGLRHVGAGLREAAPAGRERRGRPGLRGPARRGAERSGTAPPRGGARLTAPRSGPTCGLRARLTACRCPAAPRGGAGIPGGFPVRRAAARGSRCADSFRWQNPDS